MSLAVGALVVLDKKVDYFIRVGFSRGKNGKNGFVGAGVGDGSRVRGKGVYGRGCVAGLGVGSGTGGKAGHFWGCGQAADEDWVGLEEGPHGVVGDVVAKAIQLSLVKDRVGWTTVGRCEDYAASFAGVNAERMVGAYETGTNVCADGATVAGKVFHSVASWAIRNGARDVGVCIRGAGVSWAWGRRGNRTAAATTAGGLWSWSRLGERGNSGRLLKRGNFGLEEGNLIGRCRCGLGEGEYWTGRGLGSGAERVGEVDGGGFENVEESSQAAKALKADGLRTVMAKFVEKGADGGTPVQNGVSVCASEVVLSQGDQEKEKRLVACTKVESGNCVSRELRDGIGGSEESREALED